MPCVCVCPYQKKGVKLEKFRYKDSSKSFTVIPYVTIMAALHITDNTTVI